MKKILYIIPLFALAFIIVNTALGQQTIPSVQPVTITDTNSVISIVTKIISVFYTLFFVMAVAFILLAAWGYLTAGGDPAKVKKASTRLIFAIVAIAVALISYGVASFIQSTLSSR
jgi:phosphoglycerol transferase MdoB-like AlkP superfamily enzyme